MSNLYERDGGHYVESILLVFLCCHYLVFGLYMMILWVDMIDYEQYIHQTRSTDIISINAMKSCEFVIAYVFSSNWLVLG